MTTNPIAAPDPTDNAEEWRSVAGFDGLYEVSSLGRVRSVARYVPHKEGRTMFVRARILKPLVFGRYSHGAERLAVALSRDGDVKMIPIYRLVADAFLEPDLLRNQVNHKDFNPSNNAVSNLEWTTAGENIRHSMQHGRMAKVLSDADIKAIMNALAAGESQTSIGARFGVSQAHVSRVKLGQTWHRLTVGK